MGTSDLDFKPALTTPVAQLNSPSSVYIPQFLVDCGESAKAGDFVEGEYTTAADTSYQNILGRQYATLDDAALLTKQPDFINEPSLVNGNYIYRFRTSRPNRTMPPSAWCSSVAVTVTGNYGLDMSKPLLSLPSGTTVSDFSATYKVTTNKTGGKIYVGQRSSSATPLPSDTLITTGVAFDVTVSGEQTYTITGLSKGTNYYPQFVHVSATGVISDVAVGELFTTTDSTPPVASGGVVTPTSATTANATFQLDQPHCTVSIVATGSVTQPSVTNIEAGKDHTGASVAAGRFKTKAQLLAGTASFADTTGDGLTALTAGVNNYFHMVARDELGQPSNVHTITKMMPAASDTTAPIINSAGSASQSSTTGISQMQCLEGNGNARMMLTTVNSAPSIATIEGTAAIPVTAPGIITVNWTGLTPGQLVYAWGFQRDNAGNPAAAVISLGSFTPAASALKVPTFEIVSLPDAPKPAVIVRGSIPEIGDELTINWTGPTSGSATRVFAGTPQSMGWQSTWSLPDFPVDVNYTLTITHKRGATTQTSLGKTYRRLPTPNSGPIVPSDPPPVVPPVVTNYLVRKDGTSRYLRKDGSSFLLAR